MTYGLASHSQAARPDCRSDGHTGAAEEHTMTASLTDPKTKHFDHAPLGTDELELKGRIDGILNRHPAVGLAVGVIRNGRLEFFSGHGLADIAATTPITQDTVFRIGSITKTFTAVAVLQLWEQGLVDLDAPVNDYLRAYRLLPAKAGHRPATLRQLLTHTAGLPQLVYPWRAFTPILGETVRFGQQLPSLAEFYRGGLHLVAEPGTRCTYSNHGFATLGQLVEDVSGTPLDRYFRERIFEPLAMADTDLLRSERVRSRLATAYALRTDGPHPVGDWDVVTVGAGSIYSTTTDMARYVAALLGGGTGKHGSILQPETLASLFRPTTGPIRGYQVSAWRSSATRSAGIWSSSTRGWCPASAPSCRWRLTTGSGWWPSPTGPGAPRPGWEPKCRGCSGTSSVFRTR